MKSIYKFTGIRKKLIMYYLITILLLGITSLFSYYNAKIVLVKLNTIITDYVYLNNLNNDVNNLMIGLEEYLSTKSSDALLNYYTSYNDLQAKGLSIPREAVTEVEGMMLKNIGYMIDNLLLETDNAVRAKRERISSEYIAHFTRSNEISEYIKLYINNLLNDKLQKGSFRYGALNKNMTFISYSNLIIIIASVILNIFLVIVFTYRLTKPIVELAQSAERVSNGIYDVEPLQIETDDEINILTKAFNDMVVNIRNHIDEIKYQAEIEKKLQEQELQNFKMKSLLKDAELKSLQSQINPHFLFNTLNAASQLAMMEGADRSSELIENTAELFRYNLRKLEEPVTLADEIKNVKNYMYILKTRFGNKLEFFMDIDSRLLHVKVPCTIIQPIIENAYIHGLEDMEKQGKIHLKVRRNQEQIIIEVEDNGMGMEDCRLKSIISEGLGVEAHRKHVSGIGMHNVINRLKLFYSIGNINEVIEIESKLGLGTKVMLKIPFSEDVKEHD